MRTDDLVLMLARGPIAVAPRAVERRFVFGMAWGLAGSAGLMIVLLGVRADLAHAALLPMFWIKLAFAGSLALMAFFLVLRLARPGSHLGSLSVFTALPVLLLWALAAVSLYQAENHERTALVLGQTWAVCSTLIALLSSPVFVGVFAAMKDMAPTRPRLAGAAAGLLAGATGTLVYCIHCPEMDAPFLGVWYVLGMLIPVGVGAALGGRFLRW
jgi:hypothetical protein